MSIGQFRYCGGMRIPTAPIAAAGLIGGFAVASSTGSRPAGGVVLALGGAACAFEWYRHRPPVTASALLATYVVAFGVSHPLAKEIGAWPSVLAVSAVTAGAAAAFADSRPSKRALTSD